jgi:Sortase domain
MSIHRMARAARDGIPRRWRPLAAALPAALLLAGGALIARGLLGPGGGPHAQPLPARVFSIAPAAARRLPAQPPLARPQPGSIQAACVRLPASQPQIAIPSLCIYAPLVGARVAGGALVIPADVHLAGFDTQSAALGARHGTTIIAGHVDNVSQGDGAFYFLYQIKPGALITVTGPGRRTTTWRAYKTVIAEKTALPSGIWSLTGPRRLILVTCGGPLEHTQAGNTYRDNILIYATPATT